VKIVLLQQLGAAEAQHVKMYGPAGQLSAEVIGALLRLIERHRRPDPGNLAVFHHPEAGQQQPLVDQGAGCVEVGLGPESHGRHDFRHQPQQRLPVLLLVLPG
jgi:hypothetical protein